jgi:hypothetical protein
MTLWPASPHLWYSKFRFFPAGTQQNAVCPLFIAIQEIGVNLTSCLL